MIDLRLDLDHSSSTSLPNAMKADSEIHNINCTNCPCNHNTGSLMTSVNLQQNINDMQTVLGCLCCSLWETRIVTLMTTEISVHAKQTVGSPLPRVCRDDSILVRWMRADHSTDCGIPPSRVGTTPPTLDIPESVDEY